MQFIVAAFAAFAAVAVAQESSSSIAPKSPFQVCLEATCPDNLNDVNCQATCKNVPNPNASMVAATTECIAKCAPLGYQEAIDCTNNCYAMVYNPSGVVVSDHLTAAGVSSAAKPTASSAASSAASTPASTGASSAATHASSAATGKSSDLGSLEHEESASGAKSGSHSAAKPSSGAKESSPNGAAQVAGSLAAVAIAAAALF